MFKNICLAWCCTYLIIVGYEMMNPTQPRTRLVPHLLMSIREVVLMLCGIFYYVASAFFGAFAALYFFPPTSMMQGKVEAGAGIIAGIWVLALFLQFSLNFVREYLGVPTQPIVWFNRKLLMLWRKRK